MAGSQHWLPSQTATSCGLATCREPARPTPALSQPPGAWGWEVGCLGAGPGLAVHNPHTPSLCTGSSGRGVPPPARLANLLLTPNSR